MNIEGKVQYHKLHCDVFQTVYRSMRTTIGAVHTFTAGAFFALFLTRSNSVVLVKR